MLNSGNSRYAEFPVEPNEVSKKTYLRPSWGPSGPVPKDGVVKSSGSQANDVVVAFVVLLKHVGTTRLPRTHPADSKLSLYGKEEITTHWVAAEMVVALVNEPPQLAVTMNV